MIYTIFLFIKISSFFLGISLALFYLFHRILFAINKKRLEEHFPQAFEKCFNLITDFYKIAESQQSSYVERFLQEVIGRKKLNLPKKFADMPSKVVRTAYHELTKLRDQYKVQPEKTISKIRTTVYQQYFESYRQQVLHKSLGWLISFIPVAFAAGLLVPLVFYFYYPSFLIKWPITLSIIGLGLGGFTTYLTLREYYFQRK